MSTWTHITGCIRIDGIPALGQGSEADTRKALGNTVSWEDDEPVWDACSVPCGSEGSLQYTLVQAGDGLVLWTVPVWGDLRDFDNIEQIQQWFDRVTKDAGLFIRDAILRVSVEGQEPVVLTYEPEQS